MKVWQWIPAYNCQVNYNIVTQLLQDAEFFDALTRDAKKAGNDVSDWEWQYKSAHGCDLNGMRNKIVHEAIEAGVDFLLMQDADVYATKPALPRLLKSCIEHQATAAYALVLMRTRPAKSCIWPMDGQPIKPGEVFEINKAGSGMVLIDLNRIRPWYAECPIPLFWRHYTDSHAHTQTRGQDVHFAKLVTGPEVQGKLICDGTVPTVHVDGTHELSYDGEHLPAEFHHPEEGDTANGAQSVENK